MQRDNEYSTVELAAMFDLTPNAFRNRVYRRRFPKPTRRAAQFTYWDRSLVAPFLPKST
jgi:hypothetical protein